MSIAMVFGKSAPIGAAIALTMSLGVQAQGLPGVFGGQQRQAPVVLAQAGSQDIEQQMRELNGRMEDLNFQIMQLQEQVRKMQEDNEFRFQQLEGGSGGGNSNSGSAAEPEKQGRIEPAAKPQQDVATAPAPAPATAEMSAAPGTGEPPRDFGSITFDPQGNVVGGSIGDQTTVGRDPNGTLAQSGLAEPEGETDGTVVAALPAANDPAKLYDSSYKALMAGDYRTAEAGFRKHTEAFPGDARAADTQYWLGESLLGQQKFAAAVDVFAAGAKKFPEAKRAPEMMFKLGVSLASINRRDVACAAFKAVGERYPTASPKLLQRAEAKFAESKC